jgi:hypothetical protein
MLCLPVKDTCPELLEYDALVDEAWHVQPSTGESLASSGQLSAIQPAPLSQNWVCAACSFDNDNPSAVACEVCDTPARKAKDKEVRGKAAAAAAGQGGNAATQPPYVKAESLGDHLIAYSPLLPFVLGATRGDWRLDKVCPFLYFRLIFR